MRMAPNDAVQDYWQQAFDNVTSPTSQYTYLSTSAGNKDRYGKILNMTAAEAAAIRGAAALGK